MTEQWFDFKELDIATLGTYLDRIKLEVNAALEQIVAVTNTRIFENTVQPLINVYTLTSPAVNAVGHVQNFYTDRTMRDLAADISKEINKFMIDCSTRSDVYNAFKEYEATTYQTEKQYLTQEEIRYFEHEMRDFRRNGLHLLDVELAIIKSMKKELSDLSIVYEKNINEENTFLTFTKTELDGMPDYWLNDEEKIMDKSNQLYKVTLKYPDFVPAMEYVKNSAVRKALYVAYNCRCGKENTPILERAVKLRALIANKLGYDTHADYVTETKIVKNAETAFNFISDINLKITPIYEKDMLVLLNFANNYTINPLGKDKLEPWDVKYYFRAYQEYVCNFDKEELRKYFPLDVVTNGLFKIYQELLGLNFMEIETDNKWHDDVQLFSVFDKENGDLLGYFYLDMYPRDGKFSHAAVFNFMDGCEIDNGPTKYRQPHIVTMACNFPKDECISFDDVETFFHEFGHVMHQICSKPQIYMFCGLNVERDFIETPSQFLEFYCYCLEPLQLMSSHEITKESVPKELVDKLNLSKRILSSYTYKRQLFFGMYDLMVHTMVFNDLNTPFDSRALWYELERQILKFEINEQLYPQASFGHIMSDYDAAYYGYLLTDTYAANIFYKLFANGRVLDPVKGMLYRKKMLEPGATKDGSHLLIDLLGEDPNPKYFMLDKGFQKNN